MEIKVSKQIPRTSIKRIDRESRGQKREVDKWKREAIEDASWLAIGERPRVERPEFRQRMSKN